MADRSVMFPFRIENGSVATTTLDEHAIKSKVLFCLGTEVNERVMRPDWGIDIMQTVYMIGGDPVDVIPEAVNAVFRKFFPKIRLVGVVVKVDENDKTRINAEVRFGQIGSEIDEIIRVNMPTVEEV